METTNLIPGTAEWHAHRTQHRNASDAPAMLDCSPYESRSQFLRRIVTGVGKEVDAGTQRRFDEGHRIEAILRPIAEEIIGEDLAPVVGTLGRLSASFDGLTFMADVDWECKTANADLRAALPNEGRDSHARNDAKLLPKHYRVQMEQQLHIAGAERCLFTAARCSDDGEVIEERHAWYYPDAELRAEILRGWEQLAKDEATYVAPEAAPPKPMGRIREALPALIIEAKGEIIASNLDTYKAQAVAILDVIPLPTPGASDEEFVNGKEDGKYCRGVQEDADRAIEQLTNRMGGVHDAINVLKFISEKARRKAIDVENAVAAEEKRRKDQVQINAAARLREHVSALNTKLGGAYMPASAAIADFAGAVKNKRTPESFENVVATTLANAKIAANDTADRIDANLKTLAGVAPEHAALFPDRAAIVLKAPEDLQTLVRARVAEHDAAVKRRAEEAAERERARIRAEEEARARAQAAREQQEREAEERRQEQPAGQQVLEQSRDLGIISERTYAREVAAAPAAGPAVIPMPTRAPAVTPAQATLRLGDIQKAIAPLAITADGLTTLGFPPARQDGAAKLYHHSDFPRIRAALVAHLQAVQLPQQQAA